MSRSPVTSLFPSPVASSQPSSYLSAAFDTADRLFLLKVLSSLVILQDTTVLVAASQSPSLFFPIHLLTSNDWPALVDTLSTYARDLGDLTQPRGFECRWKAPKVSSPTWISSRSCSFIFLTDCSTFPYRCLLGFSNTTRIKIQLMVSSSPSLLLPVSSISVSDMSVLPIALAENLGVVLTFFLLYSASNQQILLFLFQNTS